ncbi:MAG: hypothetical protein ABI678_10980 [Kofleriaceae bacterium]
MNAGDTAVLRGRGLVKITSIAEDTIEVRPIGQDAADGGFEVPRASASTMLRELVTREVAQAALAALRSGASDDRDAADRSIAYRRAVKGGDLVEQIRELGAIYRRPEPEPPERQYTDALETAIYGELALVLDLPRRKLKAELRSHLLGEQPPSNLLLPDRSAELAAVNQPALPDYDAQGAFAIDTQLAVGELAAELVLPAAPGIWLAYTHGDMDDADHHLVAIHRDHVRDFAKISRGAKRCGQVTANAASTALCDATVLEDREFVEAARVEGSGVHGTHCFVWMVGGDGRFPVRTASANRQIVYVRIDFT